MWLVVTKTILLYYRQSNFGPNSLYRLTCIGSCRDDPTNAHRIPKLPKLIYIGGLPFWRNMYLYEAFHFQLGGLKESSGQFPAMQPQPQPQDQLLALRFWHTRHPIPRICNELPVVGNQDDLALVLKMYKYISISSRKLLLDIKPPSNQLPQTYNHFLI